MDNTKSEESADHQDKLTDTAIKELYSNIAQMTSHDVIVERTINVVGTSTSLQSATNPCCNETKENQFPCEVLQRKLQEAYREFTLPKVPWLNDGIDLPIHEYFLELKLTDLDISILIDDIFNKIKNDKQPLRILIEGQPGYGKTTLAIKLANDWAKQENYIKHFKFVFLLQLRQLENTSIEETITELGKEICGLKVNQNAIEIVKNHQKETLFILDGLEEVSLEGRKSILKTLCNKEYKEVTVIVFSRIGLFSVPQDEHKNLFMSYGKFKPKKISTSFYDNQITILGISNKSKKIHFLQKILKEEYTWYEDTIKNLSAQLELFNSPLLLMMLIIILKENGNIKLIYTKTDIYKQLFNSIIKRSYMRSGNTLDKDVDLFNINMPLNYKQQLIYDFGEFSSERFLENKFQFERNELTNKIYDAGFLINRKEVSIIKKINHYEAFHLSFLEFAIAYALWIQIRFYHSNMKKLLNQYVMHFYETKGTSLVLVFLASLMDKDLQLFLSQIKSFSAIFLSNFSLTVKLFSECRSEYVTRDFLPTCIHLDKRNCINYPVIIESLLINGTDYGELNCLIIDSDIESKLIPDYTFRNVKVILNCNDQFKIQLDEDCNAQIELPMMPRHLGLDFRHWLYFLQSPHIIVSCLDCTSIDGNNLQITLEKQFKRIKYNYLKIKINLKYEKEIITQLVQDNQVKYLELNNKNHFDFNWNNFCLAAAQSTYLTYIKLNNVMFDLYTLTEGGTKKYKYMSFTNCALSCSHPIKLTNFCEHLIIFRMENFEIWGFENIKVEPTYLHCNSYVLNYLIKKDPKWHGFINLKHLSLYCDTDNYLNMNDEVMESWNNLHSLHIYGEYLGFDKTIIECIQKLPIEKFAIHLQNFVDDTKKTAMEDILKSVNNFLSRKPNVHLKTIDCFISDGTDDLDKVLFQLLKGIESNNLKEVKIINLRSNDFDVIPLIDFDRFNVTHYQYGSHDDDIAEYKIDYEQLLCTDYVAFCITKNSVRRFSPIPTIIHSILHILAEKMRKRVLTLPEVNLLNYPLTKLFHLEEIFNLVEENKSNRILIEGLNKIVKTTMAIKLAYDWAVNETYIKHFGLTLFIPLKNIQSIEEELIKIKKQCKLPRYFNIIQRINDCQNGILFILDGLDEISLAKQNEILQIFYKQKYSKATVVLLCKTGLFKSIKDKCAQMYKNADKEIDHHKLISLSELTNKEFLKILYPQQLIDNLPEPLELFNYLDEYNNIESFQSRTKLYKVLFNFVIKRSCNQQKFNLFHFHGDTNEIQKLIQEFGNFSLQNKNLTDNNLLFDCTNLSEQMYKTGFFLHQKSKSHYEVIHYSIMEFACAYDVWMQFQLNNSNWINDFLDPIAKLYFKTKGTSLVLPFLAGLMKSDLNTLLQKMIKFRHCFLSNFHLTVKFFKCCAPINDYKDIYNIRYFIPAEIDVRYVHYVEHDNSLKIYESLLTYGLQRGMIEFIKTDIQASSTILSKIGIRMPSLKIFLNFKEVWLTAITEENCYVKDIFQYFLYPKNDIFQCISENELNFLFCSEIESCALALNKSKSIMMLDKTIQNKTLIFRYIEFRYLRIQIENEEEKHVIRRMIEDNRVQFLELKGKSELDMSDFYNAVVNSDNLTSVDMFNVTIDLYQLTNGGQKKYKYINLNNCKVTCKEPLKDRKCCDFLSFNKFCEAMCEFEPIYLDCESEIICKLMQYQWVGFKSVQHLTLDAMCSNEIFEKSLTPWIKLDTLFIRLWDECDEDMIKNIRECIIKYKITKFIFKYDLQSATKVFELMNETLSNESVKSLKTVDLINYDLDSDEFKSEIDALLDGLGKNWEKVNLISDFISDEILTFFDLSRFYVDFYMYGSDDSDPEQYKIAYNNEMQSELYTFSITRKQE